MTYEIEWSTSGPCYASEADKERGAEAYRASIDASGISAERIAAADAIRGEVDDDDHPDPDALAALDAAESAAEHAVTDGWADQTADSGVHYWISRDVLVLVRDGQSQWMASRDDLFVTLEGHGWARKGAGRYWIEPPHEGDMDESSPYARLCNEIEPIGPNEWAYDWSGETLETAPALDSEMGGSVWEFSSVAPRIP